jgi:hypothetical protein
MNTLKKSLKNVFFTFAALPQVATTYFSYLRRCRKSQKRIFHTCGAAASRKNVFFILAALPQVATTHFSHLRRYRKSQYLFYL